MDFNIMSMIFDAGIWMFVFMIIIYIYLSLALQTIAKRQGHPHPWLAWIPFASTALIFQLGEFHWAWVFLILGSFIPFVGVLFFFALFIMTIISHWRFFEKENFPGWLSFSLIIYPIYWIVIGIFAWKNRE
jgi:hypothetical protein